MSKSGESGKSGKDEKHQQASKKQPKIKPEDNPKLLAEAYSDRKIDVPRYRLTARPVTNLPGMCKKSAKSIETTPHLYLPVVRYSGVYYGAHAKSEEEHAKAKADAGYCGTFYYIEQESHTLLNLGKTAVFATKVHALYLLFTKDEWDINELKCFQWFTDPDEYEAVTLEKEGEIDEEEMEEYREISYSIQENPAWQKAKEEDDQESLFKIAMYITLFQRVPEWYHIAHSFGFPVMEEIKKIKPQHFDHLMAPFYFPLFPSSAAAADSWLKGLNISPMWPSVSKKNQNPSFTAKKFPIGLHDVFDTDICKMAEANRIDSVILQREMGSKNAVSEILDTRHNSFEHLVQITDQKSALLPENKIFPTVWFFYDQGFVTPCSYSLELDPEKGNVIQAVPKLKPTPSAPDLSVVEMELVEPIASRTRSKSMGNV